jgi:GDP-D-mannose dehydratase
VEGIWQILQLGEGDDFVLATGESHTVRELSKQLLPKPIWIGSNS